MIHQISIEDTRMEPKFRQIEASILSGIDRGTIKQGDQLPSIHTVCEEFSIAPGTVAKAYENLKNRGIIASHQGKGFYIASIDVERKHKIFLLFDRLNAYKEILYYSFIEALGQGSEVEVFFHHYNVHRLTLLIDQATGNYSHYVIMPHFNEDITPHIQKIPRDKLYLLDKSINRLKGKFSSVYQDFEQDMYGCLQKATALLSKYSHLHLVHSASKFQYIPRGIVRGFERFGKENPIDCSVLPAYNPEFLKPGHAYIIFPDNELLSALKAIREKSWVLGREIGIISYDDTPMKELLFGGITTITTDFKKMGKTLARLISENKTERIANPSALVVRGSL